ncbi:hypothetical protein ACVWXN_000801 [Bradyrhizobium sp. i1.4.4]
MTKASGTRRTHSSGARSGKVGRGSVPGTAPTTLTPLLSRPSAIVASVAATSPISAPGIFALTLSAMKTTASTPSPMQSVNGLVRPSSVASTPMRSSVGPLGDGSPSTPGSCETMMWTEMPARKPTITGTDRRLAMPPRRKAPLASIIAPTISASAIASP